MTATTERVKFTALVPQNRQLIMRIVALIAFTSAVASAILGPLVIALVPGGADHAVWLNNGGFMALSWFDTGFARRELEGTLIRLFTTDPILGGIWFDLISCALFVALAGVATLRAAVSSVQRTAIGLVFVAVLFRVAQDVGRTDAAVMVCGLISASAAKSGRWIIVSVAAAIALAFHETGLVVIAPLVAAVAIEHRSWRGRKPQSWIAALFIIGLAVAAYAWSLHAPIDVKAVARKVHAQFRDPPWPDRNVYLTLSGTRGLKTMLCARDLDTAYLSKVLKGAGVAILAVLALRPKRLGLTFLATLPAFGFLSVIAIDVARWAVFAAFGAATMATLQEEESAPVQGRMRSLGLFLAAALTMLLVLGTMPQNLSDPVPALHNFRLLGPGAPPTVDDALGYCDPAWRAFLGLPAPLPSQTTAASRRWVTTANS